MKRPDESFPRVDDPIDLGSPPDPDYPKGTHPIFHLPSHRVAERILGSYCRTLPRRRYIVNIFLLKTRLLLQKKRCVRYSFEGSWWTLRIRPLVKVRDRLHTSVQAKTWFVQLQTNKFRGLLKDFSRTNYSFQGRRFI